MTRIKEAYNPEANKVYDWEWNCVMTYMERERIPLSQCQTLVNKVCKNYNVPPILVKDGRGDPCGRFVVRKETLIQLPRAWRTNMATLHEVAHYISDFCDPKTETGAHGSVFVRNVIDLYCKYMKVKKKFIAGYTDKQFNKQFKRYLSTIAEIQFGITIAHKNKYPFPNAN